MGSDRRIRWYQFRLSFLLVVVAICSVIFGWIGSRHYQAERQKPVIKALRSRGARVGTKCDLFQPEIALDVYLNFTDPREWGDAELELVSELETLQHCDFARSRLSDEGLKAFERLRDLRSMCISKTNITDAGMASIAKLRSLRTLSLQGTAVSDASVPVLASLPNLELLYVDDSRITECGIRELKALCLPRRLRVPTGNQKATANKPSRTSSDN